jgi:hypothetical protein
MTKQRAHIQNAGTGKQVPPVWTYLKIYFMQKDVSEETARKFFLMHERNDWKSKRGCPISNWKTVANEWIWNYKQQQKSK